MIKRALITAGVLGTIAIAAPASAVTVVATAGAFAAPTYPGLATTTFDFNSGNAATELGKFAAAGFTVTSAGSVGVASSSTAGSFVMPTPGDSTPYAYVQNNSGVSMYRTTGGFNIISLYLGSVDTYNSISILNTAGTAIATYTGTQLLAFATPAATPNGQTSYRLTFTRQAGDVAFGGLRVVSTTDNSAEFDNLVFAVPEPSTWALMLAGFGMVGMAMRSRRRRTNVVFG